MAATMPNPPSLEDLIARAEQRLADAPQPDGIPSSTPTDFVFAEDRTVALARLLGIPDGPAIDSYRYLANGGGSPGSLTLVHQEGETPIRLAPATRTGQQE